MRAKREVHRFSEYLIEGAVWGAPTPSTQNPFLFLFLLLIACLNFEQKIAGISISIHFRTVVANFNNLKTHPSRVNAFIMPMYSLATVAKWLIGLWCSGMFDFHRSDRGSNPGRGGKIL